MKKLQEDFFDDLGELTNVNDETVSIDDMHTYDVYMSLTPGSCNGKNLNKLIDDMTRMTEYIFDIEPTVNSHSKVIICKDGSGQQVIHAENPTTICKDFYLNACVYIKFIEKLNMKRMIKFVKNLSNLRMIDN